ncbi:hypothetical protein TSAR_003931 [Trichomalopsis sarcophagae]|uniref:Uncharacterized protein n=1 Tax=Trichomalopsis sarcophagae TaxID=543379 RepID=A0A232EYZ2_9HYME|nr:hypothetical protein TSAR_003931 [Trichomalopsis sarcophagae]
MCKILKDKWTATSFQNVRENLQHHKKTEATLNKISPPWLEKIQYAAIRSAPGFPITTPKNILLAESKLALIIERAKFLCDCQLTKSLSNNSSYTYKTIKRFYYISTKHNNSKTNRLLCNRIANLDNIDCRNNYNIYI